jgi:putative endonuclease
MKSYCVYIMCSGRNGTLYTGVTSNLARRVYEHKEKVISGFTKKYNITQLVHVETFHYVNDALHREKCLKKWNREWKLKLIEKHNPEWKDLSVYIR